MGWRSVPWCARDAGGGECALPDTSEAACISLELRPFCIRLEQWLGLSCVQLAVLSVVVKFGGAYSWVSYSFSLSLFFRSLLINHAVSVDNLNV